MKQIMNKGNVLNKFNDTVMKLARFMFEHYSLSKNHDKKKTTNKLISNHLKFIYMGVLLKSCVTYLYCRVCLTHTRFIIIFHKSDDFNKHLQGAR